MSFLSDLFHGNTGNLGHDLNPSNFFDDAKQDIGGKNTIPELLGVAALATGGAGLAGLIPGIAGLGAIGGVDAAAAGAEAGAIDLGTDIGADAAVGGLTADEIATASTLPDWLNVADLGSTLNSVTGAAIPDTATLTAGTLPSAAGAATDAASAVDPTAAVYGAGGGLDTVTPAAGGAAAPTATNAAGGGSFLDKLIGGATNSITKNPLGIAVAGGALGLDVLRGNPDTANVNALKGDAASLAAGAATTTASGQQLMSYLQNGTLPPGQQAQINQAVQAAKAKIIANAAANGQSTDPTRNSALAQDLAAADQQGLATAGQLEAQLAQTGQTLINTGLHATGLSSQIYESLVKIDTANNNQLMTAIASMAAALGGGTKISTGSNTFSINPA